MDHLQYRGKAVTDSEREVQLLYQDAWTTRRISHGNSSLIIAYSHLGEQI